MLPWLKPTKCLWSEHYMEGYISHHLWSEHCMVYTLRDTNEVPLEGILQYNNKRLTLIYGCTGEQLALYLK